MSEQIRRLRRDRTSFVFYAGIQPAFTVAPGESIIVETQDAHFGTIAGPEVVYETLDDVMARIGGANPVTDRSQSRVSGRVNALRSISNMWRELRLPDSAT